MVGTGVPPRMRHSHVHRRRGEARQGRGRSGEPLQPGPSVRPLPRLAGSRLFARPHPASAEARAGGPRQGQVGAHRLGRGARRDRRQDPGGQGGVRAGVRGVLFRHRPRHRPVHHAFVLGLQQPQLRVPDVGPVVLFPARRRLLLHVRVVLGGRLFPAVPRPLRQSRLEAPGPHRDMGQQPHRVEFRRPVRALGGRLPEDGVEGHRR